MMEIFNATSVEIAGTIIFAWLLMVAWSGGDPALASQRVSVLRK